MNKHPALPPLNAEFRRLLRAAGWTQAEAARRLHLSPSTISLYLSGDTTPSVTVLQLLKLMLGDRAAIPGVAEAAPAEAPLQPLDELEAALLRELRGLETGQRRQLIQQFLGIAALFPKPLSSRRKAAG